MAFLLAAFSMTVYAQDPTGVVKKNTREETFELERLGTIHVLVPTNAIKSVAIFVDGDGGWNGGISDMAQLLANEGALVAGVDTVPYLKGLNDGDIACASIADDLVEVMQAIKARYAVDSLPPPVLVGYSSGATLVFAALAQAPKGVFRGAMSLGFCTTLEIQRPLCTGNGLAFHRTTAGLTLLPTRHLNAPWVVLHGAVDQACEIDEVARFSTAMSKARLIALPKVGHGYAVARRWQPQYVAAYKELTTAPTPHSNSSKQAH